MASELFDGKDFSNNKRTLNRLSWILYTFYFKTNFDEGGNNLVDSNVFGEDYKLREPRQR